MLPTTASPIFFVFVLHDSYGLPRNCLTFLCGKVTTITYFCFTAGIAPCKIPLSVRFHRSYSLLFTLSTIAGRYLRVYSSSIITLLTLVVSIIRRRTRRLRFHPGTCDDTNFPLRKSLFVAVAGARSRLTRISRVNAYFGTGHHNFS